MDLPLPGTSGLVKPGMTGEGWIPAYARMTKVKAYLVGMVLGGEAALLRRAKEL